MTNFESITKSKQDLMGFAKLYATYPNNVLVDWDKWFSMESDTFDLPYRGTVGEYLNGNGKWLRIRIIDIIFSYRIPYARIVMPGGMVSTCPLDLVRTEDEVMQKRINELLSDGNANCMPKVAVAG